MTNRTSFLAFSGKEENLARYISKLPFHLLRLNSSLFGNSKVNQKSARTENLFREKRFRPFVRLKIYSCENFHYNTCSYSEFAYHIAISRCLFEKLISFPKPWIFGQPSDFPILGAGQRLRDCITLTIILPGAQARDPLSSLPVSCQLRFRCSSQRVKRTH